MALKLLIFCLNIVKIKLISSEFFKLARLVVDFVSGQNRFKSEIIVGSKKSTHLWV